jgi:hypothetical protein
MARAKNFSRSKGRRGEILVRDALSEWTGVQFNRTPYSGAIGSISGDYSLVGDIYCKDPSFQYSVEIKNVENWTFEGLLKSDKTPVLEFWLQTVRQAKKAEKHPLLCVTKARQPIYCLLTLDSLPKDFGGKKFVTHLKVSADGWILHTDVAIILLDDLVKCQWPSA